MKILILGANGTLGHEMFQTGNKLGYEMHGTVINYSKELEKAGISKKQLFSGVNIEKEKGIRILDSLISTENFDVIINCIGIINKKIKNPARTIYCNSVFPHILADICSTNNAKLIHISTDCVFSGRKSGEYTEKDEPDALDLYGKSKELGEINYRNHLTIRTSFIGREIHDEKTGLLEWFLSQSNEIEGYSKAIWSGFTSYVLSHLIYYLIENFPDLKGIVQVASHPIDKYSLLLLLKKYFKKDISIRKNKNFICNRSLGLDKRIKNKIDIPSHEEMIKELAKETY